MRKLLYCLCFTLLYATSGLTHAAVYARAALDWGAAEWTTTGDLTFEVQTFAHVSRLDSGCCGMFEGTDGVSFSDAHRQGIAVNLPGELSAYTYNDGHGSQMTTGLSRSWNLTTMGSGTLTLAVPWEMEWYSDGEAFAYALLGLYDISNWQDFEVEAVTHRAGSGATGGTLRMTFIGNGATVPHVLLAGVTTTVGAVPEPETWAGLLAGLGALAQLRRSRASRGGVKIA